jgi:hypothetical protein
MRNLFRLALLLILSGTIFGCAHNYYNIPQATLEKKVKVIGVAPFFIDADSDIRHPDKGAVAALIQGYNAKNEKELIARLRSTGTFYAVRQVDGDAPTLYKALVASKERRDDAGIIYNKYFYKKDALKQLMKDNGLDALLLVTVSGLTRPSKIYSSNYLSYLETDLNYLALSAQLLDRDGEAIWEYPNFKRSVLSYNLLFPLQYPDFDEAAANLSEKVDVKFKTITGVNAAFAKSESSSVPSGPQVSTLYVKQYEEMLSLLKTPKPLFGGKSDTAATATAPPPTPVSASVPVLDAAPAPAEEAAAPEGAATPAAAEPAAAEPAAPVATAPNTAELSGEIAPERPVTEIAPERPAK